MTCSLVLFSVDLRIWPRLLHALVRPSGIQHVALLFDGALLLILLRPAVTEGARLQLALDTDGSVATEALAHVDLALFAFGVSLLELLALGGKRVFERRTKAVAGLIPLDHDAVGVLEAEGERRACNGN